MSRGPQNPNEILGQGKLGTIVKTTRIKMNMTQQEFASVMHVPVSTLTNWESGVNNPPEYFMDLLGVRFAEYRDNEIDKGLGLGAYSSESDSFADMQEVLLSYLDADTDIKLSNRFIAGAMMHMITLFEEMNEKLTNVSDVLSYNFDDGCGLTDDDLDDTEDITDEDLFCLNSEEQESGKVVEKEPFVDVEMYLASRHMTDEMLNENYSTEVVRQLGRTVITDNESSEDEIDLSKNRVGMSRYNATKDVLDGSID